MDMYRQYRQWNIYFQRAREKLEQNIENKKTVHLFMLKHKSQNYQEW